MIVSCSSIFTSGVDEECKARKPQQLNTHSMHSLYCTEYTLFSCFIFLCISCHVHTAHKGLEGLFAWLRGENESPERIIMRKVRSTLLEKNENIYWLSLAYLLMCWDYQTHWQKKKIIKGWNIGNMQECVWSSVLLLRQHLLISAHPKL